MKTSQLCVENTCCGCGACAVICPKNAILMSENQYGFIYPKINEGVCIDCGACKKICVFSTEKKSNEYTCYACANINNNQIMKSASGGAFSAIATAFLKDGGYVCGAASEIKDGMSIVEHKIINKIEELPKLQGSKYVQSNTLCAFKKIPELLKNGEKVLFSGTPCQVDAIKSLCRKYVETSLFTIDIICHGVPSQKLFNGYLDEYQRKLGSQITYIDFRNKEYGWGLTGISKFANGYEETITPEKSSYYKYFLDGEIYRDNCYNCSYANLKRVGDLTVGDYWGFQKFSPELKAKSNISEKKGVSCLIINNKIGQKMFDKYGDDLAVYSVEIEKVMIINAQLREPACHTKKRAKLLTIFANKGYAPIEKNFQNKLLLKQYKDRIKRIIPKNIKNIIKKIVKRQ